MAIIQRVRTRQSDAAPIWLPRHDANVIEQASVQPPDFVDGYNLQDRLLTTLLGSRWKMVKSVSIALVVLVFLTMLPTVIGGGIGLTVRLVVYQSWTLGLMLLASMRVRSTSVGTVSQYWLVGFFAVVVATYFVSGPLSGLAEPSIVWVTPFVEELLKAVPLVVAALMGRRIWRHPGLSDLMVLGFAIGAGYGFHEAVLWESAPTAGFGLGSGLLVPSIMDVGGLTVAGHAVWTSLVGLAIGLVVLHRRHPAGVVGAIVMIILAVGDHMAANDTDGTLASIRRLFFNGGLTTFMFIVAVVAAVVWDRERLRSTSVRDHLFPSDRTAAPVAPVDEVEDISQALLCGRYRRLRNGMHTTVNAVSQQWPARSETHEAPVAELARLGRAAGIAVGPGTSSSGWTVDPESASGQRYVGPDGFTAYVISASPAEVAVPTQPAAVTDPVTGEIVSPQPAVMPAALGSQASISIPKARPDAVGIPALQTAKDFWQYMGVGFAAIGLFVLVRLLTAGDAVGIVLEQTIGIPGAPGSPALIRGLLGALAAAVSLRGRDLAVVGPAWNLGPADAPNPDRPAECEV